MLLFFATFPGAFFGIFFGAFFDAFFRAGFEARALVFVFFLAMAGVYIRGDGGT
ncbi:MAG TPA: hypothetical protein VKH46_13585 [Thermoanaerobaculia bacterium]|nr:hypothetical protein [Thermoanaerobaculia bacterium]